MAPAFSSPRQAAAFALLLAALLAAPGLMARIGWPDRRNVYPAVAWKYGPFPWIQQKIFAETSDVDIAFLGSSHVWNAVNTPYVKKQLSEQLGRDAEVFTLGWPWNGFDSLYVMGRDLLNQRRVRMLVIDDEDGNKDLPHRHSSRWFRIGDDPEALAGLPWLAQARVYGGAVLGMPRQLLSLVRPNLLEDPAHCRPNFWNSYYRAPNLAEHLGSLRARLTYRVSPDFAPFEPRGEATPADVLISSTETRDAFKFTRKARQTYQLHFAQKLAQLCHERGTRLVILHTPEFGSRSQTVNFDSQLGPEILGAPVDIVGIPPAKLFAGIPTDDFSRLFYDELHLNENGQNLFTPLITPVLLKLYAESTDR